VTGETRGDGEILLAVKGEAWNIGENVGAPTFKVLL
jgi:hypothetical protein